jgi:hypothetical protein
LLQQKGKTRDDSCFYRKLSDTLGSWLPSGTQAELDVVRRYGIAFLEKYVAGKPSAETILRQRDPMLARYVVEEK